MNKLLLEYMYKIFLLFVSSICDITIFIYIFTEFVLQQITKSPKYITLKTKKKSRSMQTFLF